MNENCPSCKQPYPFHAPLCSLTPPVAENIRVMSETPKEWKSSITDDALRGIVRDFDPKRTGQVGWEPVAKDSLWQLAYELLRLRRDGSDAGRRAIEEAERVKTLFAERYQERLSTQTSEMDGNMDWARLEGAVAIVSAIRALTARLEEAEKEAERYNFLRSDMCVRTSDLPHQDGNRYVVMTRTYIPFPDNTPVTRTTLDAAIDAALAPKPDTGKK